MLILLITWKIGRHEIVWWHEIITLTNIIWTLLSFVKNPENSFYTVHDNNGMKLVTCLKLDFNHLKQEQLKHSFLDTINPMCSCGSEPETAVHSPLDYQNHKVIIIINSFIVSRGWFLTYIHSNFGSTSFGLTSLFFWIPLCTNPYICNVFFVLLFISSPRFQTFLRNATDFIKVWVLFCTCILEFLFWYCWIVSSYKFEVCI